MFRHFSCRFWLFLFTVSFLWGGSAQGQVTSDSTVNTQVNQNGNIAEITGGEVRGSNLFHSFQDFSVPTGNEAFFNNSTDIGNIFSRVTGGNISDLNGAIRANGTANLFLINPAGIILGENARLDIGGSFYGSTASSILFADGEFSATDLNKPPLLTINAPIGLGLENNPGEIVNLSTVQDSEGEVVGLEVLQGKNLNLVGGRIEFEGGNVTASGGNVELGGLSAAGIVEILDDGSLIFPSDVAKADITLENEAEVDVTGSGGGNIVFNSGNLNLSDRSFLDAGINQDSTSNDAQAGNIVINLTDNLTLDNSRIRNLVDDGGIGNSGRIDITTGSISATNGGRIAASVLDGRGNAGGIELDATGDITFSGSHNGGDPSGAISIVLAGAEGNGGDIKISAANLTLEDGGRVNASTGGIGNGGDIDITTRDTLFINTGTIEGDTFNPSNSVNGILTRVNQSAEGNGGNVSVTTNNLNITNGATISTATFGQGNAGSVDVIANEIKFEGANLRDQPSVIASRVEAQGIGNAGDINIAVGNFTLTNGGQINAGIAGQGDGGDVNITATESINITSGDFNSGIFSRVRQEAVGNAGDIIIVTDNLTLGNGGLIDSSTFGLGNAGLVEITPTSRDTVSTISIDGENSDSFISFIGSRVDPGGKGNSEGVIIVTDNLNLTNGGYLDASTFSQGNSGSIDITAENITFDGRNSQIPSSAFSQVNPGGEGNAGDVTITTNNLTLRNGGLVSASTFGTGDSGNINLQIKGQLTLENGGRIEANIFESRAENTFNIGEGGNINIAAGSLNLSDRSRISAETRAQSSSNNSAANIILQIAEGLTLENNSSISAEALNGSNGGNVEISTDDGYILAFPNQNNDIIANAEQGQGGNIEINTQAILGIEERSSDPANETNDIDTSSQFGLSGTVEINVLNVDPSQGSLEITGEPVKAEVSQTCHRNSSGDRSEFFMTGRGGLPTEPEDNFRLPTIATAGKVLDSQSSTSTWQSEVSRPIIQATRWVRNEEGQILLLASPTKGAYLNSYSNSANCNS